MDILKEKLETAIDTKNYSWVREQANNLNWVIISRYKFLTPDFLEEFEYYIHWNLVRVREIPEPLLEKYITVIAKHQGLFYVKLPESFMRKHHKRFNWYEISSLQTLSEDFMRDFKDYVDWTQVSINQTMSYEFVIEFLDYLCVPSIFKYNRNTSNLLPFDFIISHLNAIPTDVHVKYLFLQLTKSQINILNEILKIQ